MKKRAKSKHRKSLSAGQSRRVTPQPGTAPGTLAAPATQRVDEVTIRIQRYDSEALEEFTATTVDKVVEAIKRPGVTWVDIVGLHDVDLLSELRDALSLHPLALEDVVNTNQRPKVEDYGSNLYLVARRLFLVEGSLANEQLSLFIGDDWVLTFQEVEDDVFDPVRERLRNARPRIRGAGADYLAYALLDTLIDHFFPLLEAYGEEVEALEVKLLEDPDRETLQTAIGIKRELLEVRRACWPLREVVHNLDRQDSDLIRPETRLFLRDTYDHIVQILDIVETYRDMAGSLMELYLSSVSQKMNEVMSVLTITASIFIPLTFIAGIYGMNFDPSVSRWNMPELSWKYGYLGAWGLMIVVGLGLVALFRHKKWL